MIIQPTAVSTIFKIVLFPIVTSADCPDVKGVGEVLAFYFFLPFMHCLETKSYPLLTIVYFRDNDCIRAFSLYKKLLKKTSLS